MSPTSTAVTPRILDEELSPHRSMNYVIKLLMGRAGISSKAALAVRMPTVKKSTLYTRLDNDGPDWTGTELRELAVVLGVPVGVLFAEPSPEAIADELGISYIELMEQVIRGQNRKEETGPDLHVVPVTQVQLSIEDIVDPVARRHLQLVPG